MAGGKGSSSRTRNASASARSKHPAGQQFRRVFVVCICPGGRELKPSLVLALSRCPIPFVPGDEGSPDNMGLGEAIVELQGGGQSSLAAINKVDGRGETQGCQS